MARRGETTIILLSTEFILLEDVSSKARVRNSLQFRRAPNRRSDMREPCVVDGVYLPAGVCCIEGGQA